MVFWFVSILNLNAQTYLSPLIGVDYSKIYSPTTSTIYEIQQPFSSSASLVLGLEVERDLMPKVSISLESLLSRKKAVGKFRGIVGYEGIEFNTYRVSFGSSYNPNQFFSIGGGGNITLIDRLRKYKGEQKSEIDISMARTYSLFVSSAFHLYNFTLKVTYLHGFTSLEQGLIKIKPINSVISSIGYRFKI